MSIESYVAKKVLEKIAYAYQETCFVCGLQWELKKINDISFTMKAVLLDAEEKQVNHRQLRLWLADLKDAFYDAEDVLDEFECEAQRRRVLQLYGGIIRKVGCFFSSSNPIAFRFKMSTKIKQIRERLEEIASLKSEFRLKKRNESRHVMPRERAMTHTFVQVSEVIGRDKDKENIIRLLQDSGDRGQVSIIPIVGVGGKDGQDLARFGLQKLILVQLPKLVEFPRWLLQGSTNTLQLLKLESCENLKELPACLQNIVSLQRLIIEDCYGLSRRCELGKGEDWSKIAHVPKIVIDGADIDSIDN
ncbi:hypothetical protein GH714_033434 [Hevea brasiliensis]|uniref:Disease resistance N-terminal domain-containing protein n=1 Tax=Hevea brasiliensis TaxID=3981 RepID=A0A6A6M526_HEVBR|nr:hypothetical protein GH714_033434 [Hevea brasiliensis]